MKIIFPTMFWFLSSSLCQQQSSGAFHTTDREKERERGGRKRERSDEKQKKETRSSTVDLIFCLGWRSSLFFFFFFFVFFLKRKIKGVGEREKRAGARSVLVLFSLSSLLTFSFCSIRFVSCIECAMVITDRRASLSLSLSLFFSLLSSLFFCLFLQILEKTKKIWCLSNVLKRIYERALQKSEIYRKEQNFFALFRIPRFN